jgi:cellulose synthase/poly-beta-1,6-N-acetylglucosamine synthase-like glycosyltransferase
VGRSGMRKAIKENFKYIYLMMSLIMVIIFGLNNEFVKAAVTGIFAFEYIKIMMLSELSEYLKTSVIILYKGDESEVSE